MYLSTPLRSTLRLIPKWHVIIFEDFEIGLKSFSLRINSFLIFISFEIEKMFFRVVRTIIALILLFTATIFG